MLTFISLILAVAAAIQLIRMSKYEFNNRTVDGVIQFSSYGADQAHFFLKRVLRLALVVSIIAFLVGMAQ